MKHDNIAVSRKASLVLAAVLVLWFTATMLLGTSTSGVELNAPPSSDPPQPGELPACVAVHTYDSRGWGGLKTVQSDVWLRGCNTSSGELRVESGPTCRATSLLGAGKAICTASPDGTSLKVSVRMVYPFGLNLITGPNTTTTFWIDHSGGYHS